MKTAFVLIFLAVVLCSPIAGNAVKVEITPYEDSYVLSSAPTTPDGSASTLLVKHDAPPAEAMARAFLKFDLSLIPADATIQAALLYLYDETTEGGSTLNIYAVDSGWSETVVNWDNQPSYDPAIAGILPGYTTGGWYNADVTSVVEEWRNGLRSNYGLLVKEGGYFCPVTVPACGPRTFRSRENHGFEPYLMVIFDANTVDVAPDMDAHVKEAVPGNNYGSSETLEIGDKGRWSYLKFDPGSIPADATIEYARLRLYQYSSSGGFPGSPGFTVSAHPVTGSWTEGAITWETKPTPATTPESFNIGLVGGDYVGWVDLDVTSSVEGWFGGGNNYGVVVRETFTAVFPSQTGNFRSREYTDPEYEPRIEVFYSFAPPNEFTPGQSLTGVYMGDACWGDIDGDGHLDLVVCGDDGFGPVTSVYTNHLGTLTEDMSHSLPDINGAIGSDHLDFGDYDNDGDLDLAIAGESMVTLVTQIYTNNGSGTFTLDTRQSLTPVRHASLTWGDYDNDGDLDLYVQGRAEAGPLSVLYENDGTGLLSATSIPLTDIYGGSADWVDLDGDNDLDLAVTGADFVARYTIFYENDSGSLTSLGNKGLPNVAYSDMAWGDYDNDGDMDLAFMGESIGPNTPYTRIYRNGGGGLEMVWNTYGLYMGACAWGDFTNDGKLDVVFCGDDPIVGNLTYIFYNDGTNDFTYSTASLVEDVSRASASWADVDNDGDIDLFLTGEDNFFAKHAVLYENTSGSANTPPTPPSAIAAFQNFPVPLGNGKLHITWSGATDTETSLLGLYYCVRVGTERNFFGATDDVFSGTYGTPLMGNVGEATTWEISIPYPDQPYYVQIKTIDAGLMASEWSDVFCTWDEGVVEYVEIPVDEDAFVSQSLPTTPLGLPDTDDMLNVGAWQNSVDISRTYLKFGLPTPITELATRVLRAELLMTCTGDPPYKPYWVGIRGEFFDSWSESSITWNNAPTGFKPGWTAITKVSGPGQNIWDVTRDVKGSADNTLTLVAMGYTPPEGSQYYVAEFFSKEYNSGSDKPMLRIWYSTVTGIGDDTPELARFALSQNVPNPFNPDTRVSFTIPNESSASHVSLKIYDVSGRLVRTLVDEPKGAGLHTVEWNGRDAHGSTVASGVYFYRLQWNGNIESKKMVLLR